MNPRDDSGVRLRDELLGTIGAAPRRTAELGRDNTERRATLSELDVALPAILGRLRDDRARWILILELEEKPALYVQLLAVEDGPLVAECVSNESVPDALTIEQDESLPLLGWEWPQPPNKPNWSMVDDSPDAAAATGRTVVRTLDEVFGCHADSMVLLRLFRSSTTPPHEDAGHFVPEIVDDAPRPDDTRAERSSGTSRPRTTSVPESRPSSITIASDRDRSHISVGDRIVVTEPDVAKLIEAAHDLGGLDPLKLPAGASLRLDLPRPQRAAVLTALTVDEATTDYLWLRQEEAALDGCAWEIQAIDNGISVDGQPWGWFLADEHQGRWHLVPAGPGEVILDAALGFEGASMVSGADSVGIRRWSDLAAVSWWFSDASSESTLSVNYEVEDWNQMFLDSVSQFCSDRDPICPYCQGDDWSLRIDADPMFSDQLIGQAMASVYRPDGEHRNMPEALLLQNVAGHDWRWVDDSWVPT